MNSDDLARDGGHDLRGRFEAVATPHLEAVYRVALRLCGSQGLAEDLVQETFLRAYRAFGDFELREFGCKPWLLKILRNVYLSRIGHESRQPRLAEQKELLAVASADDGGKPPSGDDTEGLWEHCDGEIKRAVESLPEEYRTVLLLWAIEELSYKEIADVCDCPLGTVMSRLHRARKLLSGRLRTYAREQGYARG